MNTALPKENAVKKATSHQNLHKAVEQKYFDSPDTCRLKFPLFQLTKPFSETKDRLQGEAMTSTSGMSPHIDLNPTRVFDISPNYLEAMDNARFIKTCGIAALIFSVLTLLNVTMLNVAVSIGIGFFMLWHDHENYYRAFGVAVLVICSAFFPALSPLIFSFAIFWKGREVLKVLVEERRSEENWPLTFRRARIGTISSAIGLGLNCMLIVFLAAFHLIALLFTN